MAMAIILSPECTCLHPGYHRPGDTYEYDGLWEHHQRGPGLRYCGIPKKPATPFGYFLSYALY